jgi:hypothetical protein
MKLTKEDYMRLPKERLAELLVEMQEEHNFPVSEPIAVPAPPSIPPYDPYRPWQPWPVITWTTNDTETIKGK